MEILIPELGEGIDSADVIAISVAAGDTIGIGQALIEVETEKAAVEIPSEVAGTVTEVHVAVGQSVSAGQKIVTIDAVEVAAPNIDEKIVVSEAEVPAPIPSPSAPSTPPVATVPENLAPTWTAPAGPAKLVAASPSIRRFAREIGIDINQVKGTGPGSRLTKNDVKAHSRNMLTHAPSASHQEPELPDFSRWGSISEESASKIRRVAAERLSRAWRVAPQVTNHDKADITHLEDIRKRFKKRVSDRGGNLTMTAILVKVAAMALHQFPDINSSYDPVANTIFRKHYVHIGVAVDTEHGLLVPVIRNADQKSITGIAIELNDLAERARNRKLRIEEMEGASFTISNLGGIGGTGFSPIVNWPEVGILGVSRGRVEATWFDDDEGGGFEPRLMLPLSLSYDHRLVDGAMAARFLRWTAEALEEPLLLTLGG